MASKRVLYLSQEIFPYLPETEIANVSRFLPQMIQEAGNEVRIFMPRYGIINERRNQLHEVIRLSGLNLIINDNDHQLIIKVASIQSPARLQVYFIDNEDFFKRKAMFDLDAKHTHNDNDERSIFFVRGALETVKKLKWKPDVIHCHGLFTALAVIYLKKMYHDDPLLGNAKIVYSIYDEKEPVEMTEELFKKLKFDNINVLALKMMDGKTDYKALSKLAIHHSDAVVLGSENIDSELLEYIKKEDRMVLEYPGKDINAEPYDNFYNSVLQ